MRGWLSGLLAAIAMTALTIAPAPAQKVALLIGNSDYKNAPALRNPVNDVADIGSSLSRMGFTVTTLTNASTDDMQRAAADFSGKAKGADIALIFFAGHAVELEGMHWSIPVDGKVDNFDEIKAQSVSLERLLAATGGSKFALILIDTARDYPFAKDALLRPVIRDNAPLNIQDALIFYSTKAGQRPLDGEGRNSPFAAALLKHMETAGLDIRNLANRVRDDVMAATQRKQEPFSYGSLPGGDISLAPR